MSADDKTRILPGMANTNVGTQLSGIYELDERIASGGMGEVYRGHNIQTGDHVAIKIVLPEFARDQTILSLFRKEASILNHLSHDAIVRYHVFTIDPGIVRPYLAMEYVDGVSLADLIARGPMEAETVRRLIARIASGLSAAHAAGVIHRDLSPDNVILPGGKVEKAKIIDFGIARSATVGGETLIGGGFAGKYNYVSPEQLGLYGGEVSERSDIYSLGLVLAAALRGKPIEMSGSQFEIVEKRRTVPDLSDIDGDFRPIVEAMLQPDPRNRPASMAEIAAVTRGGSPIDIDGMMSPNSVPAHDRQPAWPQTEQPASANPWVQLQPSNIQDRSVASKAAAEPRFVPHVRPAHLSQPHPAPSAPRAITPKKSTNIRNITIAALTAAVVASGAGVYLAGFVPPWRESPAPDSGETSRLTPDLSNPPTIENATAGNQPAEEVAPPHTQTEEAVTPSGNQPDAAGSQGQESTQTEVPVPSVNQPDVANDQSQTTASDEQYEPEVATIVPKPQAPLTDAIDGVVDGISWLRDYRGGDCFYATATSATDKAIEIEGFGTSAAPFETMLAEFKETHKIEPEIGMRLIEQKQCAVADFLQAIRNSSADRPLLTLSSDIIKSGQSLRGTLGNLEGRKTDILLVDNAGVVYNLASHLKQEKEKASFNIKLGLASQAPVPQIIIALTSPKGLDTAKVENPILAERLFPKILQEINSKKVTASATAKYFKLGG